MADVKEDSHEGGESLLMTESITVELTEEEFEAIEREAKAFGMSMEHYARMVIMIRVRQELAKAGPEN